MIPKRTLWMTVGYSAGIASTVYVRRRVRRVIGPTRVDAVHKARHTAAGVAQGVKVAVSEGRAAMRDTERDLRAEYQPRQAGTGRQIR